MYRDSWYERPSRWEEEGPGVPFGPQDRRLATPLAKIVVVAKPELQFRMKVRIYARG